MTMVPVPSSDFGGKKEQPYCADGLAIAASGSLATAASLCTAATQGAELPS